LAEYNSNGPSTHVRSHQIPDPIINTAIVAGMRLHWHSRSRPLWNSITKC